MPKNTDQFKLDENVADEMLQNILKTCDIKPNNIPLNKLQIRHKENKLSVKIAMFFSALFFLLTLFSPLCFAQPADTVSVESRALKTLNIIEHSCDETNFYITLNELFDFNEKDSYMELADGTIYKVISYDLTSHTVTFAYPPMDATVFLYTMDGKLLQLHVTISD